jgi:hypothetical protein
MDGSHGRPIDPALSRRGLVVCVCCRGLRGEVQPDNRTRKPDEPWRSVPRLQHCCIFIGTADAPGPSQARAWPGFDLNTAFELCRGCAVRVLRSGMRFSPIFCSDCRRRVLAHNGHAGWRIVPISRHSLPNGELLRKKEEREPGVTETFVRRTGGFSELLERLSAWKRTATQETLARCGLPLDEDIPLSGYLDAVAGCPIDESYRFRRMLAFLFDVRPAFFPLTS